MDEKSMLKCQHCGQWGEQGVEVEISYNHVGGQGDRVPVVECINRVECWERWDSRFSLKWMRL